MMFYILGGLAILIIGIALGRAQKQKVTQKINDTIKYENESLEIRKSNLEKEIDNLEKIVLKKKDDANIELKNYLKEIEDTKSKMNEGLSTYQSEQQEKIDQQIAYQFLNESEKLTRKIEDLKQNKLSELDKKIDEVAQNFALKMDDWEHQKSHLGAQISELRAKRDSIIEAAKHEEEIRAQADFYKLNLPEDDIHDYWELKKLENKLNKKDVLNKLIYKTYFEKPYTDLVGRVIGAGRHTGIYKITNLNNRKVYVGQAVDLRERWKQHIKRGIGAEPATQNKLYPAMKEDGVWNFTFEVIEECDKDDLNEREQYYQEVFGAKEYGYSIK